MRFCEPTEESRSKLFSPFLQASTLVIGHCAMENFGTTKMAASQLVFTRFSQPCTFSMSSRFLLSNPAGLEFFEPGNGE